MNHNNLKILELELQKKKLTIEHLNKKLNRYKKANSKITNTISKEEIEDLVFQIESIEIEMQILQTKIQDSKDAS